MSFDELFNDNIEEWISAYRKYLPRKAKDEVCEKLFFYLKLKYKDNKLIQEKHDGILQRVEKRMKDKEILQKKAEDEQLEKLRNAKTGVPITITKAYAIVDQSGKDDGKRFIRKKDAEDYVKGIYKKPDFVVFNEPPSP